MKIIYFAPFFLNKQLIILIYPFWLFLNFPIINAYEKDNKKNKQEKDNKKNKQEKDISFFKKRRFFIDHKKKRHEFLYVGR